MIRHRESAFRTPTTLVMFWLICLPSEINMKIWQTHKRLRHVYCTWSISYWRIVCSAGRASKLQCNRTGKTATQNSTKSRNSLWEWHALQSEIVRESYLPHHFRVWDAWTLYWHPTRAGQPALAPCPTRPGNIGPLPNPVVAVPTFKNVWLHLSKSYTTQAVVLSTLYITANSRAYKRCEHDHVTTYTTDHD